MQWNFREPTGRTAERNKIREKTVPQLIAAIVLSVILGACASTTTTTDAEGNVVEVKKEKPKMRCTRTNGTGSRLENRVCVPVDD